jgi:maleate isomerase
MSDPEISAVPGRIRLGMLTPSSNSVLEPVSARMLADMPGVTAHASRFRVTQIGLSREALDQFATDGMVAAAELLADANVASIMWNGTSAAWLGFESDERLAEAVSARTGVPASSSVLAFRDAFRLAGASPDRARHTLHVGRPGAHPGELGRGGFSAQAERHAGLSENFAFARLGEEEIAGMVRDVAADGVDAVAIVCTNMAGACARASSGGGTRRPGVRLGGGHALEGADHRRM